MNTIATVILIPSALYHYGCMTEYSRYQWLAYAHYFRILVDVASSNTNHPIKGKHGNATLTICGDDMTDGTGI